MLFFSNPTAPESRFFPLQIFGETNYVDCFYLGLCTGNLKNTCHFSSTLFFQRGSNLDFPKFCLIFPLHHTKNVTTMFFFPKKLLMGVDTKISHIFWVGSACLLVVKQKNLQFPEIGNLFFPILDLCWKPLFFFTVCGPQMAKNIATSNTNMHTP